MEISSSSSRPCVCAGALGVGFDDWPPLLCDIVAVLEAQQEDIVQKIRRESSLDELRFLSRN
jgi:hypothetical protein